MSLGMKSAAVPSMESAQNDEDDWETDPDFINDVNEKEGRWGAKTVDGSGHQESIRLDKLREEVLKIDQLEKERKLAQMPRASEGYGGKFGVQMERVDQCAVGFEYQGKVEAHASQRDYSLGFGGTFGVQKDRVDKSAVGWDSHETLQKHESQKDYKMGFGGQFGIQSDRKDKSAAGWDEKEQTAKHESQTDYKKGFGGQFGVQSDRKDKSALGWDEVEKVKPHESQTDYKKGFGGQFGVQSDRKDKSALGWEERDKLQSHESQTDYKKGFGGQFGVQSDRKDKTAHGWEEHEKVEKHESQTDYKKGFGGQFGVQSDRQDKSALGWDEKQREAGEGGAKAKTGTERKGEGSADQMDNQSQSDGTAVRQGAAKSLRSKFEQMAAQGDKQNLDRAREERERRKREDEQLRQQGEKEERQRQQRLEQQWTKLSEEGEGEGERDGDAQQQQQQRRVQPPRQRPTIGVRLPYATAAAPVPLSEENNCRVEDHLPENEPPAAVPDNRMDEAQLPPVKVLPTAADCHKMDTVGVFTREVHDPHDSLNSLVGRNEGKGQVVPKSGGEWVDPTTDLAQQIQEGTVGQQRQQIDNSSIPSHHQYELPPIVEDGAPSSVVFASEMQPYLDADTDQNAPPPADPTPAVSEQPIEQSSGVFATNSALGTTAIALFEYERQDDDEISFEVNDLITDIEQIDAGWWRGVCKGRYGLFPANYVQLMERK